MSKKPSVGESFVWLIGKPGQWDQIEPTISKVVYQKAGGVFRIQFHEDATEEPLECMILWDQKLKRWIRYD